MTIDENDLNLPVTQDGAADAPALADSEPVGNVVLSVEERAVFDRPFDVARAQVKPTGEPYFPAECYRSAFREGVGVGAFGEKVTKVWKEPGEVDSKTGELKTEILYVNLSVFIRGVFVASAVGSTTYRLNNKRINWGDTYESAVSNAFMRCAKHCGIGLEPWQPTWRRNFLREHCVQVQVNEHGQMAIRWRRKDADPFPGEVQPRTSTATEARATAEQVAQLEELTRDLDADAVAQALKHRRVSTFNELSTTDAQHIIHTLTPQPQG